MNDMNDDATPVAFTITDTLDDDLPEGFIRQKGGIYFQPPPPKPKKSSKQPENSEPPEPIWICSDLEIEAETADETSNSHGLLLRWIDRWSAPHTWVMPRRMVHGDGKLIAAALEDAGLSCSQRYGLLKRLFSTARSKRRVRSVDRAGWHDGPTYLRSDGRAFGPKADALVMQSERPAQPNLYAARGTLAEWQDNIARFAPGNDLLTLAISAAFAPPLLDITGEPSGGIHFRGPSRTGKTTLLCSAASVMGPGDTSAQIRTWRATANGLEAVAAETSDGLLVLDEMGQAASREVADVIYMLANQTGKARATHTGDVRRHKVWRVLFLSTGEVTPEQKIEDAGQRTHAGQGVRLVSVSADAGLGWGVWQNLYGMASPAALSEALIEAARRYCGTAFPTFLAELARDRADEPAALTATLRGLRERFLDAVLPPDANGQVRSVASRFALIAAAGELATGYGITGWDEGVAQDAAAATFRRWLSGRGGPGAAEDMAAIEAVRRLIALHGASRFELLGANVPDEQRIINRAGWRRKDAQDRWEYLILPAVWRAEICQGLDFKQVAAVLLRQGLLMPGGDGRPTQVQRIGSHGVVRVYWVRGDILNE